MKHTKGFMTPLGETECLCTKDDDFEQHQEVTGFRSFFQVLKMKFDRSVGDKGCLVTNCRSSTWGSKPVIQPLMERRNGRPNGALRPFERCSDGCEVLGFPT
jgi:hypothetical protein